MGSKGFSLVLGGGSARGLAHIGIIRRLEEIQKTPSLVVGTSMGALVGAFYATGHSSSEMETIANEIGIFGLVDPDILQGGIKGDKVMRMLKRYFGEKTFADAKIPLKIIATNLSTGEKIVFQEGKIIEAVRASISIPGVFVPYRHAGTRMIDGGIVANLAVEESLRDAKVIAVSVQIPIHERSKKPPKKPKFLPIENPFVNTYLVLRKAVGIMIIRNEMASLATRENVHFLRLGHPEIDYHNFKKTKILIEAGYQMGNTIHSYLEREKQNFSEN